MGKKTLWETKDIEVFCNSMAFVADGVKTILTDIEALSANSKAVLQDMEISLSTALVYKDIKLAGAKALSDGLAALIDEVDVIRTAAKTVSTSTKTLLAGIEILSIKIDSIYNDLNATSTYLEAEVKDLLDIFKEVDVLSTVEIAIKGKRSIALEEIGLPMKMISDLNTLFTNLERMSSRCGSIKYGMHFALKGSKTLTEGIDMVFEPVEAFSDILEDGLTKMETLSNTSERVTCEDKETIYGVLKDLFSILNDLPDTLEIVNSSMDMMYLSFKLIHDNMILVNKYLQKGLEDIKAVFEGLESFLSLPPGMIIALNSW